MDTYTFFVLIVAHFSLSFLLHRFLCHCLLLSAYLLHLLVRSSSGRKSVVWTVNGVSLCDFCSCCSLQRFSFGFYCLCSLLGNVVTLKASHQKRRQKSHTDAHNATTKSKNAAASIWGNPIPLFYCTSTFIWWSLRRLVRTHHQTMHSIIFSAVTVHSFAHLLSSNNLSSSKSS